MCTKSPVPGVPDGDQLDVVFHAVLVFPVHVYVVAIAEYVCINTIYMRSEYILFMVIDF
jgi:hypothetical protein